MFQYSKDGVTVSIIHDTRRLRKDGGAPVKIRVTYLRKRAYYSTGKSLTPEQWDKLSTTKGRDLSTVRKDIEHSYGIVRAAVEELITGGAFSFAALNMRLKHAPSTSVNTLFAARLAQLKEAGQVGNMTVYTATLKGIERFAGDHVEISSITPNWLTRYAAFLDNEGKKQTTIAIHLRTLRAIINEARRAGLVKESQYPFGRGLYEIQAGTGRKMALTVEQIGKIAQYNDGSDATAKYRDYWLFLYLCNGINVADFVKLRYRDIIDGEICFVRQKTERTTRVRKEIRAIITEPMQRIIDRWGNPPRPDAFIFPILDGTEDPLRQMHKTQYLTRAINKRLAIVGEQLGIGHISTYTARHSFATVLKRSGANIAYISESLGHSDLKTTENYLASFEREERQKNAELLIKF